MPDADPPPSPAPKFGRVVLKLSGESFSHAGERGISMQEVVHIARQTTRAAERGVQIAIVIGGGNILRGAQFTSGNSSIQEATAHYMGMLATVINGLALQDALESLGCATRLASAIRMDGVAEPYIRRRARRRMYGSATPSVRMAVISRVLQPSDSKASCKARPLIIVANMPM